MKQHGLFGEKERIGRVSESGGSLKKLKVSALTMKIAGKYLPKIRGEKALWGLTVILRLIM
jgi:hypothetical protein